MVIFQIIIASAVWIAELTLCIYSQDTIIMLQIMFVGVQYFQEVMRDPTKCCPKVLPYQILVLLVFARICVHNPYLEMGMTYITIFVMQYNVSKQRKANK